MTPRLRAEVHLLPTHEGGRIGPLPPSEWRTIFGVGESNWSGRLLYAGAPAPGDTFECSVQLLVAEAYEHFPVQGEFTVWEGGTKGKGRVLAVAG
jgi:hypothetical protein